MLPPAFGVNFPRVADWPIVVGAFSASVTAACAAASGLELLWLAAGVAPELELLAVLGELVEPDELVPDEQAARRP